MEQSKIDMFIMTMAEKFPPEKIMIIKSQLEKMDDNKFIMLQAMDYKNPTTMLIISIFLGALGVDRFMLGHTGLGVGKLLTGGGCGIWWFIDLFLITKATKDDNFMKFSQVAGIF